MASERKCDRKACGKELPLNRFPPINTSPLLFQAELAFADPTKQSKSAPGQCNLGWRTGSTCMLVSCKSSRPKRSSLSYRS